jgi:hypothetical protein
VNKNAFNFPVLDSARHNDGRNFELTLVRVMSHHKPSYACF